LDPEKKGKIRVDVFEKVYTRMGQYLAIAWIKYLFTTGELNMFTKTGGKRDIFFTKEEVEEAFAVLYIHNTLYIYISLSLSRSLFHFPDLALIHALIISQS